MRPSSDPRAIEQYRRDYDALADQPEQADLDAFVSWLAECDEWDDSGSKKQPDGSVRIRFNSFDELWTSYCFACLDMRMQAVPHSVLQNSWKEIGSTDRPNRGRGRPRLVNYIIDVMPSRRVLPFERRAADYVSNASAVA